METYTDDNKYPVNKFYKGGVGPSLYTKSLDGCCAKDS